MAAESNQSFRERIRMLEQRNRQLEQELMQTKQTLTSKEQTLAGLLKRILQLNLRGILGI